MEPSNVCCMVTKQQSAMQSGTQHTYMQPLAISCRRWHTDKLLYAGTRP
jgi:hypothetical protein